MESWTSEDLMKYLDHCGLDRAGLEVLQKEKVNGAKLKHLYDKGALESVKGLKDSSKSFLKIILQDYRPCDPVHCVVEGLVGTLSQEQLVTFKIITRDSTGRMRSAYGQNVGINVDEEEFQIHEVFDNRNGEIEVSIVPLKVGPFKIAVTLGGSHIKSSPFIVVVGPVPPPIHTLSKSDLDGWIEVARGNYGKVYKGRCNNLDVAIKEMLGINKRNIEQKIIEFLGEVNILQRLHHPNIITFLGVCIDSDNINEWYIVLEWADKASLQKVLQTEKNLSIEQKFQFAIDIARGMAWLHQRKPPIIHFDLKPVNILVLKDYTCKIADFGLSAVSEMKDMTVSRGTMLYMPPETLRRKWYHKVKRTNELASLPAIPADQVTKIDIYSFGLIMWEIFVQDEVFLQYNDIDGFCEAVCDKNVRPELQVDAIPLPLREIVDNCWAKDPTVRPGFKQCVPLLDACRIKSVLQYPTEFTFWNLNWPSKHKILMDEFMKILFRDYPDMPQAFTGLLVTLKKHDTASKETDQHHLNIFFQKLLRTTTAGEVTLAGYRRLLEWFGPLNHDDRLLQFINLLNSNFFHPLYDSKAAQGIIQSSPVVGAFLVRLNLGDKSPILPAPFTITYRIDGQVTHSRIHRADPTNITSPLQFFHTKNVVYQHENVVGLVKLLCEKLPNQFSSPVEEESTNYQMY